MRKINLQTFSLAIYLLLSFFDANCQDQKFKFDRIDTDQGLSQGNVTAIFEDHLGFMWIATEDGLNKYDGYSIEIFITDSEDVHSIDNNKVEAICEDLEGNLWVGTRGGLQIYNRNQNNFGRFIYDPNDPESIAFSGVMELFRDSKGNIWIGMSGGLVMWDPSTKSFTKFDPNHNNPNSIVGVDVTSIAEDENGQIWIGINGGVSKLRKDGNSFENYTFDPASTSNILTSTNIESLFVDSKNRLWIGSFDRGIVLWNLNNGVVTNYESNTDDETTVSNNFITRINENEKGEIWIASDNGLNKFNEDGTFVRYFNNPNNPSSLSGNIVMEIVFDRNQRMWVGSRYNGMSVYDEHKYGFQLFQNSPNDNSSLSSNNTSGFVEDPKGNFYVATDGEGINYFDRKTGTFSHIKHNPDNPNSITNNKVLAVELDNDGNLWIGMWAGGVNKYNLTTQNVTHYINEPDNENSLAGNNIFDIHKDRNGNIWVGTWGKGLCRYQAETDDFKNYRIVENDPNSFQSGSLSSIIEDRRGNLWLASGGSGVYRFNPSSEELVSYRNGTEDDQLSDDGVLAVYIDSKERVWIGTNGSGLNILDQSTGKIQRITEKDGLPNDAVMTILEDNEGNYWIATNRGLAKFDYDKFEFRVYYKNDGLQDNQFMPRNAMKLTSGELLFGGNGGFNLFDPRDLFDNPVEPLVYITGFKLFDREVTVGENEILTNSITFTDKITLNHNQNLFSFSYIGINYRHTQKNQYRYMLEGLHEEWVEAGTQRNVSFMNLEPGDYTLKVNASNNDRVWSSEPAELKITVVPPFWNTWWFRSLSLMAITGFVFWFIRSKSIQNAKAQELLKRKIDEATEEVGKRNEELQGQSESLKLAIEETNYVVREAVESGNFKARIDLESKTGEWKSLGESINQLFDSVTHPFNSINFIVNRMAQGDLTERYREEAKGDIQYLKENLNIAMDNLSELLLDISIHVDDIKSSSNDMLVSSEEMNISTGEIASSIAEMSKGAQEQVDKVDESSNLIEGVLKFSSEVGGQAESINQTAKMGAERSETGKKRVTDLDVSMKDILEFSSKTNESIDALTSRSEEISTVLRIIKDIASQTNLLALNAAIEAAQAGDAGRGFAVVAEEIRKLAEDSKKSAGEIEDLVQGVQSYTSSTAELMGQMNSRIKQGEEATAHTKEAFEEITKFYSETLDKSEQILKATKQQTEDIGNVVNIINGVVVIAEETAAGTEETASSSSQLSLGMTNYTEKSKKVSGITDELKSKVAKFKLDKAMESLKSGVEVET